MSGVYTVDGSPAVTEASASKLSAEYMWYDGSIDGATGSMASTSKLYRRTFDFVSDSVDAITVESGYKISIYAWLKYKYKGCWNGETVNTYGVLWFTGTVELKKFYEKYPLYQFRIVICRTDGGTITESVGDKVLFLEKVYGYYTKKQMAAMPNSQYVSAAKKQFLDPTTQSNMKYNYCNVFPTFVHVSDLHGDGERYNRAFQFAKYIGADAILQTGDLVRYHSDQDSGFVKSINDSDMKYYCCIGNHDVYEYANEKTCFDKYIGDFVAENNYVLDSEVQNSTYFYADITERKIRIISFNQFQRVGQTGMAQAVTQEQVDFLCASLLSTPADYGVVILIHGPENAPVKTTGYEKFKCNITRYNGVSTAPVYAIVDAFISGTTINRTFSNPAGSDPASYTATADFSAKNAGVEFICYCSGHLHTDNVYHISGTNNKQLMLNVCCSNAWLHKGYNGEDNTEYTFNNEGNDIGREIGTPTEDAFNVYCIDRHNKQVKIVRIGSGLTYDFSVNRDYMCIPYAD